MSMSVNLTKVFRQKDQRKLIFHALRTRADDQDSSTC
jgi:hypothetical protein